MTGESLSEQLSALLNQSSNYSSLENKQFRFLTRPMFPDLNPTWAGLTEKAETDYLSVLQFNAVPAAGDTWFQANMTIITVTIFVLL